MALNFDDDITSRIARQRKQQMAASMGKTVEQMDQDSEYFDEIKAIDVENKYASDQEAAEEAAEMEEWAAYKPEKSGPQPESEAARNARLEGERQANVLGGGVVPEKMDTGTYTALDTATAAVDSETQNLGPEGTLDSEAQEEFDIERASEKIDQGREASRVGFLEEEAPPWEENPANPEVQAQLAQESSEGSQGFMPGSPEELAAAEEQADSDMFERDENNPAVKDFKELNKKAVAGDKDAEKTRADIFKGMPKEEKAMAKEELGNYYIGPGGYAINLDKLDERKEQFQREAKFSMLQYIPDHAKPQMLASWGFIDQEDVDASPDDPTVAKEIIKVAGALAVQKMVNAGANTVAQTKSDGTILNTKVLTRSAEVIKQGQYKNNTDLSMMNNSMKKDITRMGLDWEELKQHSVEIMHLNNLDLEEWKTEKGYGLKKEEMRDVRDHFAKEMKFKYKNIGNVHALKSAQLAQRGAEFSLSFGLKTTEQQQAWLVKQHTMTIQQAQQMLDNGNPTAAMMLYKAAGTDIEIDIPGYWKKQAKSSAFGNSAVSAAFSEMGFSTDNKNLNTGINGFVNEKKSIRKKYNDDAIDESTGMTKLDSWVKLNERNRNFSKDPLGPAWSEMNSKEQEAYPGGRPAWKAVMVSKVLKFEIGQGIYGGVAKAMEGGKINIDKTSKNKKGGNDNGKITPTVEPVEKAKKVEQSTPEGPKTTYGGPIQDILKDVYASRKKQIGMDGKTPKHTPGTLVNKEKMRKASLATGKKDLDKAIGTKIKGKLKYGGTPEKALDHFSQYPQELERLRNLDLKHYIMNELNKREVQGKIGF